MCLRYITFGLTLLPAKLNEAQLGESLMEKECKLLFPRLGIFKQHELSKPSEQEETRGERRKMTKETRAM